MRAFIIIILTGFALNAAAQPSTYTRADSAEIVALLQNGQPSTLHFAKKLLGRPYVAHTLEVNDDERLVVNTRQLDCTTLVETVTALTLCAMQDKRTFSDFTHALTQLRYRQGRMDGYPSRLHYFSDWIDDKVLMGLVSEVQGKEKPFTAVQRLDINYMSQHPDSYKALRKQPELVKQIAAQERALTGREYRYIPKSEVRNTALLRSTIHDGDIIAITCKKPGLDIAHLGFAVWKSDGLHLLNASQLHKKVVLEPMLLRTYLSKHPSHTGIRVIRIQQETLNNN
jgi:hypothetical protein